MAFISFDTAELVVLGVTVSGDVFQPADWAERLCEALARRGADGRKTFFSHVRPITIDGVKALVVRASLQKDNVEAYNMVQRYIAENRLTVQAGRSVPDAGPPAGVGRERRDPQRNGW